MGRNELEDSERNGDGMKLKIENIPKEKKIFLRIQLTINEYDPNRSSKRKTKYLCSRNLNYDISDARTATKENLEELKEIAKRAIDKANKGV